MDIPNTPYKKNNLNQVSDIPTRQLAAMQQYGRQLHIQHPTWSKEMIAKAIAEKYNIKLVDGKSKKYRRSNSAE